MLHLHMGNFLAYIVTFSDFKIPKWMNDCIKQSSHNKEKTKILRFITKSWMRHRATSVLTRDLCEFPVFLAMTYKVL